MRFRHFSHAGDELVVRILFFQSLQLIQKWSVLRPAIRVEKEESVRKLLFRRAEHNATERCDTDSVRKEYSCSRPIDMKSQASGWTFDLNRGAKRHSL